MKFYIPANRIFLLSAYCVILSIFGGAPTSTNAIKDFWRRGDIYVCTGALSGDTDCPDQKIVFGNSITIFQSAGLFVGALCGVALDSVGPKITQIGSYLLLSVAYILMLPIGSTGKSMWWSMLIQGGMVEPILMSVLSTSKLFSRHTNFILAILLGACDLAAFFYPIVNVLLSSFPSVVSYESVCWFLVGFSLVSSFFTLLFVPWKPFGVAPVKEMSKLVGPLEVCTHISSDALPVITSLRGSEIPPPPICVVTAVLDHPGMVAEALEESMSRAQFEELESPGSSNETSLILPTQGVTASPAIGPLVSQEVPLAPMELEPDTAVLNPAPAVRRKSWLLDWTSVLRTLRWDYFVYCAFWVSLFFRMSVYLLSCEDLLKRLGDDGTLSDGLSWMLPAAFVFCLFTGRLCDSHGVIVAAVILNTQAVIVNGFSLIPNLKAQWVSVIVFTILKSSVFTILFTYIADTFGFAHFGVLSGLPLLVAGVVNEAGGRTLIARVTTRRDGDWSTVNATFLGIGIISYPAMWALQRKRKEDIRKREMKGTFGLAGSSAQV